MTREASISPRPPRGILFSVLRPWPPRWWRRITLAGGIASALQERDWLLVLSARGIPWRVARSRGLRHIYVPALLEGQAIFELESYARENLPRKSRWTAWPLRKHWIWAPLYLLPPAAVYLAANAAWQRLCCLDSIRVMLHGEWERTATALWLHAGLMHLVSNLFFGAIFLALLARLCGIGHAWLLALLGGIAGNCLSLLIHKPGYVSVGFSTAIFASVGAVAGLLVLRASRNIFMPLAAAVGLLAMLGTQGANTDYAAHICGLLSGCALGLGEGCALRKNIALLPQWLAGCLALALPLCLWLLALSRAS